jgi:FtsH-binding integral membrane protein
VFEHRSEPVLSRPRFVRRVFACFGVALAVLAAALGIGVLGYHWTANLPWLDSLLNASMILGGMGPVDRLDTAAAKLFASLYAIFSGLVFISVMGIVLAPIVHRVLHKFHLDEPDTDGTD